MNYVAAAERMEIECKTREMSLTRRVVNRLLAEELLVAVMEWMNGPIRLMDDGKLVNKKLEMLQYRKVMLTSHTTSSTMVKAIDIIRRYEAVVHPIKRERWISEHVFAFSIYGRDGTKESFTVSWSYLEHPTAS